MKHIFIFVIMSLIAIPFAMASDSDTYVVITEDFGSFSWIYSYGHLIKRDTQQVSIISCAEAKRRADMYGSFVKNMQTDDRTYGEMYRRMELYESVYTYNCHK